MSPLFALLYFNILFQAMQQQCSSLKKQTNILFQEEIYELTYTIQRYMKDIRSTIIALDSDKAVIMRKTKDALSKKFNRLNLLIYTLLSQYSSSSLGDDQNSFFSIQKYQELQAQMEDQKRQIDDTQGRNYAENYIQSQIINLHIHSQPQSVESIASTVQFSYQGRQSQMNSQIRQSRVQIKPQEMHRYNKLLQFISQELEQIKTRSWCQLDKDNTEADITKGSRSTSVPSRVQKWLQIFYFVLRSRQISPQKKQQISKIQNLVLLPSATPSFYFDTNMLIRRNFGKQIQYLNLDHHPGIVIGDFYRNEFKQVICFQSVNLSFLNMAFNHLKRFSVPFIPNLIWLDLVGNDIQQIDLSKHHHLSVLTLGSNQLRKVNAVNCKYLMVLQVQSNQLQIIQLFWNPQRFGRFKFSPQRSNICKITVHMNQAHALQGHKFIKSLNGSCGKDHEQKDCKYQIYTSHLVKIV